MHHVPKSERGMPSEHNTGLLEVIAEISMDAGIMFQFVCLNELKEKQKSRQCNFSCLCASVCLFTWDYKCSTIYSSLIRESLPVYPLDFSNKFSHDCHKCYEKEVRAWGQLPPSPCSHFFGTSRMVTGRKLCKHSLLRVPWSEQSAQLPNTQRAPFFLFAMSAESSGLMFNLLFLHHSSTRHFHLQQECRWAFPV